jgi:hypothetical protein
MLLSPGRRWNDLTLRGVELLRKLVDFRFYTTSDQIQDVIQPLLNCLDQRKATGLDEAEPQVGEGAARGLSSLSRSAVIITTVTHWIIVVKR